MCLLVLLVEVRRSAGNVLQMVIALLLKEVVEIAEERMREPQVALENSSVVEEAVAEVQKILRDFGRESHMFARDLRLQLRPVDLERHLQAEESSLDAGSFLVQLELPGYMLMVQNWKLLEFAALLKLVDPGTQLWWSWSLASGLVDMKGL